MNDIEKILAQDNNKFFNIKIGEIVVAEAPAILKTTLGSCVAVILYDKINKIGSMIHIMFPDSKGGYVAKPGKFADTGVPLLLEKTLKAGAQKNNLTTYIVGGNYLTESRIEVNGVSFNVGKSNIDAVKMALKKEDISFIEKDIQRDTGTVAIFNVGKGVLKVKYLERFKKPTVSFKKTGVINYSEFSNMTRNIVIKVFKSISSSYNPVVIDEGDSFDFVVSINIFGDIKGKLLLYANKKFIYSVFTENIIEQDSIEKKISEIPDIISILKTGSGKLLKPIVKKLLVFFAEKEMKVRVTDHSVFLLTKFIDLNFTYPEMYSILFKVNNEIIKIVLALGKIDI